MGYDNILFIYIACNFDDYIALRIWWDLRVALATKLTYTLAKILTNLIIVITLTWVYY